ncbi:MAG: YIP1 family protein [Candidatus Omnitrophica bacterium]|nr:YIP1 family protein [Candidatus Omnitrophota bacterium]
MKICPKCKQEIPDSALRCKYCRTVMPGKEYVNTEKIVCDRPERGYFRKTFVYKFLKTWKAVVLDPKKFFACMPARTGYKDPLIFSLVCVFLSSLITLFLSVLSGEMVAATEKFIIFSLAAIPFIFINAGIVHFFVFLAGGKKGFQSTFSVCAYSAAALVYSFIPIVDIAVYIWGLVLLGIGVRTVHELKPKEVLGIILVYTLTAYVLISFAHTARS